ncbi:MAG: CDP-alcohol phosphatidyltransferase family protein [Roseibacillus sp.]
MTPATYLTMLRILLVPVFAVLAVYYARSFEGAEGNEAYRWWAVTVFMVAALTDCVDGFLARRFDQQTKLGALLDPIADKLLVLTAVITLSIFPWGEHWSIPIWFAGLVIVRDAVVCGGIVVLHFLNHQVEIMPHWTGKACSALLMITLAWVALQVIPLSPIYPTCVTAFFLVLATVVSIRQGIDQLQEHEHAQPTS